MGFGEQVVRNEIISAKSRIEPPNSLSDGNRFLKNHWMSLAEIIVAARRTTDVSLHVQDGGAS